MKKIVLIDDDLLIHKMWVSEAQNHNTIIDCYQTPIEFINNQSKYPKDICILIDSNLNLDLKGEQYAKEIYDLGFSNIHLTTAYSQIEIEKYPWLKSIIDKRPSIKNIK